MKKHILMSWVFCLLLQAVACGQEKVKNIHKDIIKDTLSLNNGNDRLSIIKEDLLAIRFSSEKEKWKIEPKFKIRNGNKLIKTGVNPTLAYYKTLNDLEIREDVDGIVVYNYFGEKRNKDNGFFKIEFYAKENVSPFKSINVDDSIPFKKQDYLNLQYGYPKVDGDNLMQRQTNMANIDKNIKNYYVDKDWHISASGYITISYILIGTNIKEQIISRKEYLLTFDNNGVLINKLNIENSVTQVFIAENKEKMFLTYGGPSSDDPTTPFLANFRIYDIKTNKIAYEEKSDEKKGAISGIFEITANLVGVSFSNENKTESNELIRFFDTSSDMFYSRTFSKSELDEIRESRIAAKQNPFEKYYYKTEKY